MPEYIGRAELGKGKPCPGCGKPLEGAFRPGLKRGGYGGWMYPCNGCGKWWYKRLRSRAWERVAMAQEPVG